MKYKTYPSLEILDVIVTRADGVEPVLAKQVSEYFERIKETPLNGDKGYIEESSLEFCKK